MHTRREDRRDHAADRRPGVQPATLPRGAELVSTTGRPVCRQFGRTTTSEFDRSVMTVESGAIPYPARPVQSPHIGESEELAQVGCQQVGHRCRSGRGGRLRPVREHRDPVGTVPRRRAEAAMVEHSRNLDTDADVAGILVIPVTDRVCPDLQWSSTAPARPGSPATPGRRTRCRLSGREWVRRQRLPRRPAPGDHAVPVGRGPHRVTTSMWVFSCAEHRLPRSGDPAQSIATEQRWAGLPCRRSSALRSWQAVNRWSAAQPA